MAILLNTGVSLKKSTNQINTPNTGYTNNKDNLIILFTLSACTDSLLITKRVAVRRLFLQVILIF